MGTTLSKYGEKENYALSGEFYFASLLNQGYEKGLLSDKDVERIQNESVSLLADKTERYNAGESSSIRVEKAQDIMASCLFTVGIWLKTYRSPEEAIEAMRSVPLKKTYIKGRKRIDTMMAAAKSVHRQTVQQLFETENVFYHSTIVEGIDGFYELYDPDYSAHEINITADYPAFKPIPKLAGIEFIQAYQRALYYENLFLLSFDARDVHHLLCGVAEDYVELLLNIYEPVLLAALGCAIAKKDIRKLELSPEDVLNISEVFLDLPEKKIAGIVAKAAEKMKKALHLPAGLWKYVLNCLPLVTKEILVAAQANKLNKMFVTPAYPENEPKLKFSFGEKMEDEQYRKVIEDILHCRFTKDKVAIIKNNVTSLADFEEVLLDGELSEIDMRAILQELSVPEVAALSKKYLLEYNIEKGELREEEYFLRKCLTSFVAKLPQDKQEIIAKISLLMEGEEK